MILCNVTYRRFLNISSISCSFYCKFSRLSFTALFVFQLSMSLSSHFLCQLSTIFTHITRNYFVRVVFIQFPPHSLFRG